MSDSLDALRKTFKNVTQGAPGPFQCDPAQVRRDCQDAMRQAVDDLDQLGDSPDDLMVALAVVSRAHRALSDARETLAADLVCNRNAPGTMTAKAAGTSHTTISRWASAKK